jgi:hypothetical protein
VVTPGKELNGKFGNYRHADLIGVPYGSKVGSRNGRGFIHVLRPTPELWTLALPHRTQILYVADIAFVVSFLNIRPGSRVVEAGELVIYTVFVPEEVHTDPISRSISASNKRKWFSYLRRSRSCASEERLWLSAPSGVNHAHAPIPAAESR